MYRLQWSWGLKCVPHHTNDVVHHVTHFHKSVLLLTRSHWPDKLVCFFQPLHSHYRSCKWLPPDTTGGEGVTLSRGTAGVSRDIEPLENINIYTYV